MAVNTTETGSLYDSLMGKAETTLDKQWDDKRLKGADYATVVAQLITTAMQLSVTTVQQQPFIDAQIASVNKDLLVKSAQIATETQKVTSMRVEDTIKQNQSAKDLLVKSAQITTETQKVTSMQVEDTIKQNQSAKDLLVKDAQKIMINNQAATELKKALLVARQTTMYDDNLRVEEAKALAQVTGMFGAGGTSRPSGLDTAMLDAINAITP